MMLAKATRAYRVAKRRKDQGGATYGKDEGYGQMQRQGTGTGERAAAGKCGDSAGPGVEEVQRRAGTVRDQDLGKCGEDVHGEWGVGGVASAREWEAREVGSQGEWGAQGSEARGVAGAGRGAEGSAGPGAVEVWGLWAGAGIGSRCTLSRLL